MKEVSLVEVVFAATFLIVSSPRIGEKKFLIKCSIGQWRVALSGGLESVMVSYANQLWLSIE